MLAASFQSLNKARTDALISDVNWPSSIDSSDTANPDLQGLNSCIKRLLLHRSDTNSRALQPLYQAICDTCAVSSESSRALYQDTTDQIKRCIEILVSDIGSPPMRTDSEACAQWTHQLLSLWTECRSRLHLVAHLLFPILADHHINTSPYQLLESLCFTHFTQQIRTVLRAQSVVISGIISLVQQGRIDAQHTHSSHTTSPLSHADLSESLSLEDPTSSHSHLPDTTDQVKSVTDEDPSCIHIAYKLVHLASEMGLGDSLQSALAEETHAYTARLENDWYATLQPEILVKIVPQLRACLDREKRWAVWLYDATQSHSIIEQMQTKLVTNHTQHLAGLVAYLLENEDQRGVAELYSLLEFSNALPALQSAFASYVQQAGMQLMQGSEDSLIDSLLTFYTSMQHIIASSFQGNSAMSHAMRDAFENVVNARDSKPAELLARYIDVKLRAGNTIMSDAELNQCMTQVLALFRFLRDKDMFEEFYKRYFAKRLLLARSASDDAERSMLLKLKEECGPDFTAKLETMLKDIQLSDGLATAYTERRKHSPFDFEVNVLTQAHWPTFPDTSVQLPDEMQQEMKRFKSFYETCHSGRSLHWRHALGFLILVANLGKAGIKELHVSTFQAAVLLAFNVVPLDCEISYTSLLQSTQLPPSELKRTLQSLASGAIPTRVLRKHPQGRDVNDTDCFTINQALRNDRRRIRINQIQHKDTREEQKNTEQRVFIDRELILQAAAMRILKARKTIKHAELTTEVVLQIKNRFAIDASELKKAFERLIEKDLMERVEGERGLYRYIA
ncbi:hypothetical protein MYAM1_002797 [Malassezia yamatoensis]|uniref:Cullin family profile domain-containing protein n=1 Tax=Malassezia yamatoensis TaxID=253288 RepID=A0AAJ5YTS6_9BASI|nr:hypothetical protein MYAM1_002797 [Malassezia yamatoensis]